MDYWAYYECIGSDPFQSGGVYERLKNNIPQTKPEPLDITMTQALEKFLSEETDVHETAEGEVAREKALKELETLCCGWVRGVCRLKNYSETVIQAACIQVYTFGSYRLGIHGTGTDIDALIVGPNYATRESDFFGSEDHTLEQQLKMNSHVSEVISIPEAIVPVIKIKYDSIAFDLVYVPLASEHVPSDLDINDISIIRNVSQDSVTSINGRRVTDKILKLVPDAPVFRTALRFLKVWAKRRGIYSNVLGYLGGINWALMLAFVQTLFPLSNPSMLILKFFKVFSQWQWPTPILLEDLHYESIGLPIWDPRANPAERNQVMPIITPAYPAFNSSYSVTENTLHIIVQEFIEAENICSQMFKRTNSNATLEDFQEGWRTLIQPFPFFETYPNFLKVVCSASCKLELMEWTGWVQSRIRRLVFNLSHSAEVRLWPIEFQPKDAEQPHQSWFWIGVKRPHFVPNRQRNGAPLVDMGPPIKEFRFQVYHHYLHHKPGMNMQVIECKPAFVPDELFVAGKNPNHEAADRSPASEDNMSTATDVPLTPPARNRGHPEPAGAPSTPPPEPIPGLENHDERVTVPERAVADAPPVENDKKRKFHEPEDKGDSSDVPSCRRRLADVDDLSCYLGDEAVEREAPVARGSLKIKWAHK